MIILYKNFYRDPIPSAQSPACHSKPGYFDISANRASLEATALTAALPLALLRETLW